MSKKSKYVLSGIAVLVLVLGGLLINLKDIDGVTDESKITYIYVDIKGEVNNPGVYRISKETRLFQLIDIAGGLSLYADTKNVNMAIKLYDEDTYYIPSFLTTEDLEDDSGLININKAKLETIATLPGIGMSLAQKIIDYRTNIGDFKSVDELLNVSGIGEAILGKIKPYISI